MSALESRALTVAYGRVVAVSEVSLALEPGRIVGLAGESGAGKSTLALALAGYLPPGATVVGGEVRFGDENLLEATPECLRRLWGAEIAYLPQDSSTSLNPALRVGGQLTEVLRAHGLAGHRDAERRALALLERVGLPEPVRLLRRRPNELSGGEQQRIALALAVACEPSVLILDEPTTGLDARTQAHVVALVEGLTRELEIATLLVSHDLGLLARVCDELLVMYAGELVERGPARAVFTDPRHPYTAALLAALPTIAADDSPRGLSGAVPLEALGYRCGFADRCAFVTDSCLTKIELTVVAPGRDVRCVLAADPAALRHAAVKPRPRPPEAPERATTSLLSAQGLRCTYGRTVALDGVSFTLDPGASLGVAGESGSGKTTLLHAIAGLLKPDAGGVALSDRPLAAQVGRRSRGELRAIQIVFQNPDSTLNPSHSVLASLTRPLKLFRTDVEPVRRREIAAAILERVELSPRLLDRRPAELSAGQRQRVAIARALVAGPEVLLCDEITSALDLSAQAAVLELLNDLRREERLSLVFVSHDLGLLRHVADDLLVLEAGQVREHGPALEVLRNPEHSYTRGLIASLPNPGVRVG